MTAPTSVTRPVTLAPFGPRDFARLIDWVAEGGPDFLMQWAGPVFTSPLDEGQLTAYLAPTAVDPPERLVWRADDAAGAPVGHVELTGIDRRNSSAVLARVLVARKRRGEGISASMIAEALAVAFDEMGLHRVELHVFTFNEPAVRCYERLGFVREGVRRDAFLARATYWSTATYSLLESEWRRQTQEEA
jgi:RimJ/RimL family protein N-acetyltransferase